MPQTTSARDGRPRTAVARLEQRLANVERQLAELKATAPVPGPQDWQRTIGMFTGDEVMKRIDEAALAYREADRKKARRRHAGRGKRAAGRAGR